eukprot:503617-Alexandrium_andersonii.AAC.1
MHRVRAHGYRSEHGARIDVCWCPACMRFFHEPRRVLHHVMIDSKRCGELILVHLTPWTEQQVYRPPTKKGRARKAAKVTSEIPPSRRAAIQAFGPLPEWAHAQPHVQ